MDTTVSLGGIEFHLRIDRIDDVGEGLLLIDYKTGPASPNAVLGTRPEEPQLPMYALSLPDSIAIGYAQITQNACRVTGWSQALADQTQDIRLSRPPAPFNGSWDELKHFWSDGLTALANAFRRGVADVDPRDAKACRECDLHALCRISELREFASD